MKAGIRFLVCVGVSCWLAFQSPVIWNTLAPIVALDFHSPAIAQTAVESPPPSDGDTQPSPDAGDLQSSPDTKTKTNPSVPPIDDNKQEVGVVSLNGEQLFTIHTTIGKRSPKVRAKDDNGLIRKLADNLAIPASDIQIIKVENLRAVYANDQFLSVITTADARFANQSVDELARIHLEAIKQGITKYRKIRSPQMIRQGFIKAAIATAFFAIFFLLLNRLLPKGFNRLETWQHQRIERLEVQGLEVVSRERLARILKLLFRIIRVGSNLVLVYIYIPFLLSCFPLTQPISRRILIIFWNAVSLIWDGFVDYLPNLFIIALIIVIARYSIKFSKFIFEGIHQRRLTFSNFYPEWAHPTQNIVATLIIGLAAVFIYPYLPAATSTGFQGVSVFIGALVTFGSTAVIGNIVSGIVMIYTRSFQVNDVIRVNDQLGRVKTKTMLSTQIITPGNEIITLPNATLFAAEITNYTAAIRDDKTPLLLKTTITLGYDVPWQKVHETLIKAALASDGILKDPLPFVFQTSLDDFYVAYTVKAYTHQPYKMGEIYSSLHQNIQDKCNEADIEILSPHYRAVRDGHMITIPADYLPEDYEAPGFRVEKN